MSRSLQGLYMRLLATSLAPIVLGCTPAYINDFMESVTLSLSKHNQTLTYKTTILMQGSAPLIREGEDTQLCSEVYFTHARATGGTEFWLIFAGKKGWAYQSDLRDWVTAEESGLDTEQESTATVACITAALVQQLTSIKPQTSEMRHGYQLNIYEFSYAGEVLDKGLSEYLQRLRKTDKDVTVQESSAHALVGCGVEDRLIHSLSIDFRCKFRNRNISEWREVHIEAEISKHGISTIPTFVAPNWKTGAVEPIGLPDYILKEIESHGYQVRRK